MKKNVNQVFEYQLHYYSHHSGYYLITSCDNFFSFQQDFQIVF